MAPSAGSSGTTIPQWRSAGHQAPGDGRPDATLIPELIRAIAGRNVEEADRLAKAHAAQITRQVQRLLTRAGDTGIAL